MHEEENDERKDRVIVNVVFGSNGSNLNFILYEKLMIWGRLSNRGILFIFLGGEKIRKFKLILYIIIRKPKS